MLSNVGVVVMFLCSCWKLMVMTNLVEPTAFTEIASSAGVAIGVLASIKYNSPKTGEAEAHRVQPAKTTSNKATASAPRIKRVQ